MANVHFQIVGSISHIQTIAVNRNIRILGLLQKGCGGGRWRKLKGVANVRLSDGTTRLAEVHWCEAHGIGKRLFRTLIREYQDLEISVSFAVCIKCDDGALLTRRKIYQLLPDEEAAKSNYVRVLDDEGEDYLYPAEYFIFLDLPHEVERALVNAA